MTHHVECVAILEPVEVVRLWARGAGGCFALWSWSWMRRRSEFLANVKPPGGARRLGVGGLGCWSALRLL